MAAVRRRTSTIPIVFTNVTYSIGQGFVLSLAHPGGRTIQFCLNDFAATL
jgi:putative ABC transport system substrate-binding protein